MGDMIDFTHLGREFHPRYATHRWVMAISLAAAVWSGGLAVLQGAGLPAAGWSAIGGAGAAFLAWAIGREIDPDHHISAILAAAAAAAAQPWLGAADLLGLAWFLGLARIVNGSTGLAPKASDLVLYYGATVLIGWQTGPVLPAVSGLGIVLAAGIHSRPRWQVGVGLLHVLTAALLALLIDRQAGAFPSPVMTLGGAAAVGALAWLAGPRVDIFSTGDYSQEPLKLKGIQAAIGLAALILWIAWVREPEQALAAWFPLLASLLAAIVLRFVSAGVSRGAARARFDRNANRASEDELD